MLKPKPNPTSPEKEPPSKKLPVFLFSSILMSKSTMSLLVFKSICEIET